ncbi:NUDIX hydrolase [Micromonospora sp. RL09-050-HVF-A]|uniref:NUDIX domain-containing protein n=1 Tax=Micromonospora sp. RL09-050-HVF-A TaxID=1703433 RepID=UPI001C5FBF11|nr:NUDIX hydrolase [Micromonospora sp. RL09-050-HVF-A]MBW4705163.1 NUDIX hydrolase [Micromonospora sp. RL09-050-HVF-A]
MAETQTEPDLSYIASVTRVRAAAGVILRDQAGRVLVVHPTYKDVWEVPGGMVEPDESPADACVREIQEELGLPVPTGPLLCVDWVPASPPWDGGLMFVFDGGVLTADQITAIRLCPDELDRFDFVEPERLGEVLIPRLARRVSAAVAAIGHGGVYLEDGVAVSSR